MNNRLTITRTLLWGTALTALAIPSLAWAQDTTATEDEDAIIITAQRRAELLEDVPMTVTVLSPDTLEAAGVNSVRDLANVTSGYQLNNAGSIPQPAIRGITTINAGSYENNVAVFVDGLYQTLPAVINIDLPNIQNVQILKGPQGTLYGRNATGGAILIETISPGDEWDGNVEFTYGRFEDMRGRGYVAGPITDSIGFSLAGYIRRTEGYFKKASRTTPGEFDGRTFGLDQESLRAKLEFDLSNNFRATLGYSYTGLNDPRGVHFTPIENVPNAYTPGTGLETRPRGLGETAFDGEPQINVKQHEAFLKLEFETGIGKLQSLTGYTKSTNRTEFDFEGSYLPGTYSFSKSRDKTWQQAVDFTIDAIENLDLIVGGTYYNIKTDFPVGNTFLLGPASLGQPFPNPATAVVPLSSYLIAFESFFDRTKKAWAVFADATFHATDKLSINVGGRYSKETQDVSAFRWGFGGEAGGIVAYDTIAFENNPVLNPTGRTFDSSYKKFSPRASIRYEITPRTSIYASYAQGFRGGEWNSQVPNNNPALWFDVGQETVTAYEVGIKSARRRLRFEVAGFYYDYKDLQVSFTGQDALGNAVVLLQSAPKAEIYGAEASFDIEPIENLKIRGGATWLHARYGDDFIFSGSGVNPNVQGFNINSDPLKTLVNVTLEQDLSGLQMSRAPDFTAYLGFDYLIPMGDGGLRFAANAKYSDSYVVTNPSIWGGWATSGPLFNPALVGRNDALLAGTPFADRAEEQRARQGSYVLINATVTWTDASDHFYVRVWGNNLTNKKIRQHYNPLAGGTYAPISDLRTIGVTTGFKF